MPAHPHTQLSLVTLLTIALGFSACEKTTTTHINPQGTAAPKSTAAPMTAAPVKDVQVFYSMQSLPPDRPYKELGLVTTQTGQTIFHDRSAEGMINKLKAEAAKMGADAIIVRSANEGTWGSRVVASTTASAAAASSRTPDLAAGTPRLWRSSSSRIPIHTHRWPPSNLPDP